MFPLDPLAEPGSGIFSVVPACKIRINDALGGTARRRLSALRDRVIAARDVATRYSVELQADRIIRIICLGLSWCRG
jgi:hypothetical protein